jgi:hypothetical protein
VIVLRRYWQGVGSTALVAVLLAGAETALASAALAEVVGSFDAAPLDWAWLWAVALLAFFLPRALHGLPSGLYSVLVAAAAAGSVLLAVHARSYPDAPLWDPAWLADAVAPIAFRPTVAVRDPLLVALVVLAVWWRQMARETPGSEAAETIFRFGPAPVAAVLLGALAVWGSGEELRAVTWRVAAFFLLTLLALACTRWIETPQREPSGWASLPAWLGATALPLGLAALLTVGLSALLFGTVGPVVAFLSRAVLSGILLVVSVMVAVVAWLVWALAQVLELVLRIFPGLGRFVPRRPYQPPPGEAARREVSERLFAAPDWLLWVAVLLVGALALYALTRLRPRREGLAGPAVSRESAWERPDVRGGLRKLLNRARPRAEDPLRALLRDPTWKHTAEVRRAYREVQRMYARRGRARAASQTAREYAGSHPSAALDELTALYQEARYSTRPAPPELAQRARELGARASAELRE